MDDRDETPDVELEVNDNVIPEESGDPVPDPQSPHNQYDLYVLPMQGVLVEDIAIELGEEDTDNANGTTVRFGRVVSYAQTLESQFFGGKMVAYQFYAGQGFQWQGQRYRFLAPDRILGIVSTNEQVDVSGIKALQQARDMAENAGVRPVVPVSRDESLVYRPDIYSPGPYAAPNPDGVPVPAGDWGQYRT